MDKKPIVVCDKCDSELTVKVETRVLYDDVEEQYFKCPECLTEYSIIVTDSNTRAMSEKLYKAQQGYEKNKIKSNFVEVLKAQREYQVATDKLNKELDKAL